MRLGNRALSTGLGQGTPSGCALIGIGVDQALTSFEQVLLKLYNQLVDS